MMYLYFKKITPMTLVWKKHQRMAEKGTIAPISA